MPLVGSYRALRMEPPIDPPQEVDGPECEEYGEEMTVKDHGRKGGLWWLKAECRGCGHRIDKDNFD